MDEQNLDEFLDLLAQSRGENTTDPEIQSQLSQVATELRNSNPGSPDSEILKSLVPKVSQAMQSPDTVLAAHNKYIQASDPEKQKLAEADYTEQKNKLMGSRSISDALGGAMQPYAQEQRYRNLEGLARDSTLGKLEREKAAARQNVDAETDREKWKLTAQQLEAQKQEALEMSDKDSMVSKITRARVKDVIQRYPKLGELFSGMDLENMTASQFKKVSPIFDKMVESSQKEVELDFKKQKAESDADLKRQSELNKLEIAQQKLASQAEINHAKLEAATAKAEKGKELSPKQQQETKLQLSQTDNTIEKVKVLKNLLDEDKINAGGYIQNKIGTAASKVGDIGGLGDAFGLEGTNNARWDTISNYIRLEVAQMMKGNPTDKENAIIEYATGLNREMPKEALKENIKLLLKALEERKSILRNEEQSPSTSASSAATSSPKTVKFGDLK